jgi:hypothetical protein
MPIPENNGIRQKIASKEVPIFQEYEEIVNNSLESD